jgi:NAD(P)-dependent dehydrogenase (short-subunit alcohol dehydrogenase family)
LKGWVGRSFGRGRFVIGLTKTAALDYGHRTIHVNPLAPEPILTENLERDGEEAQR